MNQIHVSIYGLSEPSRRCAARELWAEVAGSVVEEFDRCYCYREEWGYRIVVLEAPSLSPDKAIARYRTIEGSIRRHHGKTTLLDLSVGNLFCEAKPELTRRLHVVNDLKYSVWARHAGRVPLSEQVRLVERFVEHVMDAGWMLVRPELTPFTVHAPIVRNGRGECSLPVRGFARLARHPAMDVPSDTKMVVVDTRASVAQRAASFLEQAVSRCFSGSFLNRSPVACSATLDSSAINLVLLDDQEDLGGNQRLKDLLRQAEADGSRFKLARASSLSKPYPAQNIAYDLFQIAGGRPWEPASAQPAFCSVDAGHSTELGKSRWVKVETDINQRIFDIKAMLTPLAEHIPSNCINALWPLQVDTIVCRDGRLSQERDTLESRAASENRSLIEAKKSPKATMWRVDGEKVLPAEFGDAVLDEHGDVLLQTVPQNVDDYIRPVRLTTRSGRAEEMTSAFLHQHAMPGLSLFHMSRLPGTLYLADLISKMTFEGWPKAIGRGFRLESLVP